jgi:UDP-2,4-diacetamido-2,4,6-trideoxy-beta-L-altropyranose hydrolase
MNKKLIMNPLKMNYDFGIRIDLGGKVGSGHFFRCLGIAKELKKLGFNVIFLINNETEIKSHLDSKIPYHVLKSKREMDKIDECKEVCKKISNLIIDLPLKNELYSKKLGESNQTIIIDDLGNKEIFSKFLFNGSIVDEYQNYKIKKKNTKYFHGPRYMILRNEFGVARKKINRPKHKIKKILLTFGGTDEKNILKKIIPFFIEKNFQISLVLGPSYRYQKDIQKMIKKNKSIKIYSNVENITELFANQDLVISSSGVTSYELACLGIPCIFIPTVKHETKTAQYLEKNQFGLNYGFWDNDFSNFSNFISKISDHKIRVKMYYKGRKLVDGKGLYRLIKIITT